jgi:adenosylhomocysteinase
MSFCDQALGVEYGVKNFGKLAPGVHKLPAELDMQVAELQVEAMGVEIDTLTPEQVEYLNSWREGT